MFLPKRTKYKKYRKGRIHGLAQRKTRLNFGTFGLKAIESGRITARQIEATRRVITRKTKKLGKLWIMVFPSVPVTSKPAEVRMGKGKGSVDFWVAPIKAGTILFELKGVPFEIAKLTLKAAAKKLPIQTRFLSKIEL